MKRLIIFSLIGVLITAFAVGAAFGQAKKQPFRYEDKIGVIKLKSGQPIHIACWMVIAGPDASLGTDTKRGVEIAIDDKGGKLLGHPIKMTAQDTGCNAEGGQAAATKLAADPTIVGAIGSNCSSEAKPGAPILWKAGIATVSPSNTAPYLTDPKRGNEYDGYLRTAHNDMIQGAVAAQFAYKHMKVKKAATIHDGSVYAEQLQAVFAENFKKMGGTITSQEAVSPTDTDMRPVLTKIATGKPEFLYYPIFIAAGVTLPARQRGEGWRKWPSWVRTGFSLPISIKRREKRRWECTIQALTFPPLRGGIRIFSPSIRKNTEKDR